MKRIITIASVLLFALMSCNHDDIWEELNRHEERITQLEELCKRMNTNLSSLQTIVDALEDKDYITSISSVKVEGVIVGYTITFSRSGDVTIYHGRDGVDGADGADGTDGTDGYTPQIGVRADEDGIYYWTLDGEWILDEDGNRIKASSIDGVDGEDGADGEDGVDGTDGKDGVTPVLKIENGLWYVSYDASKTWILAGKATGDAGKDGNIVFSDIAVSDDSVTLTLADGTTEIVIPRKPAVFDVTFEGGASIKCGAGETVEIPYALSYGSDDVQIKIFPDSDLKVTRLATDGSSGILKVTAPDPFMEDAEVTLLISDGAEKTIMRTITLSLEYDESYIIRYESNTGEKVNVSMPAMLSNTYAEGIGEIVLGTPVKTVTGFAGRIDLKSVKLPATATAIGNAAFKGCTGLYKMSIPDNVTSIEDYAFADCDRLIEIDLGTGLTRIGSNAFEGCTGFTSFEIPDHVTSIGAYVFKNCSESLELKISYDLLMKNSLNKVGRIILKEGPVEIAANAFKDCVSLTSLVLPESVTSIGNHAFAGCTVLTDVKLGDKIEKIGMGAFASVPITSFVMPSQVTVLNSETFSGCRQLASVDLGAVTSIGDSVFENCIKIQSIDIPSTVKRIGARAFLGTWLDHVTFGNALEYIGDYAFAGLFFKSVALPDSIMELGEAVFASCAHLESFSLGTGLTALPARLFYYCGSLKSLELPAAVESIGSEAFTECMSLATLHCNPSVPPVIGSVIPDVTSIYVPEASLESYKSAEGWSQYSSRIYPIE